MRLSKTYHIVCAFLPLDCLLGWRCTFGVYSKPSQVISALLSRMTGMPLLHADAVLVSASNADRAIRSLMSSCSLSHHSCGLLVGPLDDPCKLVKLDVLTNNGALSLVVLVDGYLDLGTIDVPRTYATNEVIKFASGKVQP